MDDVILLKEVQLDRVCIFLSVNVVVESVGEATTELVGVPSYIDITGVPLCMSVPSYIDITGVPLCMSSPSYVDITGVPLCMSVPSYVDITGVPLYMSVW